MFDRFGYGFPGHTPFQGGTSTRDQIAKYNALSRGQKADMARRQKSYDQARTAAGNQAYQDPQIGMEGAGVGVYNAMRNNAMGQWENGLQGQMARSWVNQPAQQAPVAPAAPAGPRGPSDAMLAGQEAWRNWKSPQDAYAADTTKLYADSPQANPQAPVVGRVAAPPQFAGASGIYGPQAQPPALAQPAPVGGSIGQPAQIPGFGAPAQPAGPRKPPPRRAGGYSSHEQFPDANGIFGRL